LRDFEFLVPRFGERNAPEYPITVDIQYDVMMILNEECGSDKIRKSESAQNYTLHRVCGQA
jgi:hypothetical protein